MEAQMKRRFAKIARFGVRGCMAVLLGACVFCPAASAGADSLQDWLEPASSNASAFLETISDVNCIEHLTQERIADSGKTVEKRESAFDYLVLLNHTGGELNLVESRVAADSNKESDKAPLLVSNGFSMLLLVFHPYYSGGFQFSLANGDLDSGGALAKVNFQHIAGARSPAPLALRGREYPLQTSGTSWIDPRSEIIEKIAARIGTKREYTVSRTVHCRITYAPYSL